MILSQEKPFNKAEQVLQGLLQCVRQAEREDRRLDLLERKVFRLLLKIGFELVERYIERCGDGDLGESLPQGDAEVRRSKEPHERRYVSIFGAHRFQRYVYARREGQKIERFPVDERLGLPGRDFSYVLQDWLQQFCIKPSFEEARTSLETLLGLRVSVRSAKQMNPQIAEQAERFRLH
jgi:hypothetical protein